MTGPAATVRSRLRGYGFGVDLPAQWEGRIYRRVGRSAQVSSLVSSLPTASRSAAAADEGDASVNPVLHLANFALPGVRGDYGSGAVERMGPRHIFIALLEFGVDCLGTALFEGEGLPRPRPEQFNPNALQRQIAGQAGFQAFFTASRRPLVLYVVLGSYRASSALCADVVTLLDRVTVTAR